MVSAADDTSSVCKLLREKGSSVFLDFSVGLGGLLLLVESEGFSLGTLIETVGYPLASLVETAGF